MSVATPVPAISFFIVRVLSGRGSDDVEARGAT
jgi:hypothetical protein